MYFAGNSNGRSPKSEGLFGFGKRINRKSLTPVAKMQEKTNDGLRPHFVANTNPNLLNVPMSPGNERTPFVPYLELAKTPELPPKSVQETVEQENLLSTRRLHAAGDGPLETQANEDGLPAPMSYIRDLLSQEDDYTLEDGFKTKLEFQKLLIMDNATTLTAIIGGILVVLNYELEYEERDEDVSRVLLWMLFGSTWVTSNRISLMSINLLVGLNFIRYLQKMKFFRARMTYSSRDTLWSTGNIWTLLVETIILLIQPYPFLLGIKINSYDSFIQLDFYYHLNEIFAVLFVGRMYLLCRCVLNNLMYRSPRAYRVGDMYGAENGYMYAIRCSMKVSPFKVVPVLLGLSIFVFGYMIRICERPLNRNPEAIVIEMNSYWNSMWLVVLTMTTVGYGDVYARTIFGRIVSFVMCMWGITIVSIMVVTITNVLAMDNLEEKALVVLRRLEMKKVQKKEAAFILTNIAKLGLIKKKYSNLETRNKKNQEVVGELRQHLNSFKHITRRIKGVEDNVGAYEEVNRQIGNVREDVKMLMEKQEEFQKTILELLTGNAQLPNLSPQVSIERGRSRSRKASGIGLVVESRLNINDTEEDVVIAKTARE